MRKILFGLLMLPGITWGLTPTATPNKYMVENTSGTASSNGSFCYDFQTKPTCAARITNLTANISSSSIAGGSTNYIQNTLSPSTTTQVFSVMTASVTANTSLQGVTATNSTMTVVSATSLTISSFWMPPVYSSVTIQSVQSTITGSTATTGTTFSPTGLAATITPRFTTSRVKISVTGLLADQTTIQRNCILSIARGTTNLAGTNGFVWVGSSGSAVILGVPASVTFIDSPATTSATTYNVTFRTDNASGTCGFNSDGSIAGTAVIIVEELR